MGWKLGGVSMPWLSGLVSGHMGNESDSCLNVLST